MLPMAFVDADVGVGDTLVRLALAVVLGGAIGLEREFHGRPAGLRTHILVCLGATILMLAGLALDAGRIAAGIVTGIGFLGAGAILRLRASARGLTTAACIWFVAALGVCIGTGAYGIAVFGTLVALAVLLMLLRIEHLIQPDSYRDVVVVADREGFEIWRLQSQLDQMGLHAESCEFDDRVDQGHIEVTVSVRFRLRDVSDELLHKLRAMPGIRSIRWRQGR